MIIAPVDVFPINIGAQYPRLRPPRDQMPCDAPVPASPIQNRSGGRIHHTMLKHERLDRLENIIARERDTLCTGPGLNSCELRRIDRVADEGAQVGWYPNALPKRQLFWICRCLRIAIDKVEVEWIASRLRSCEIDSEQKVRKVGVWPIPKMIPEFTAC